MEIRDLIVAPLLLMLLYAGAYFVRPFVTNEVTRRYFFPALSVRVFGALAVGIIYQFYYGGGDTLAFHTHGSRHIWERMMESPTEGFRLLFSNGEYGPGLWETAQKIWYWRDPQSFFVIRVAAIFDLFTFSSYAGTAILFSVVAFIGGWMLFLTFYRLHPTVHLWIAIATLFVPSVIFWGSGIFKDSLTLSALGVATYSAYMLVIKGSFRPRYIVLLLLAFWVIYSLKLYILLCFLPALLLWWFAQNLRMIRPYMLRLIVAPFVIIAAIALGYYAIVKVAEDDPRYNLSRLAETAKITAYDIRFGWGARTGDGSGYTLGELDGSWQSMVKLAPQAVNVSLFRPYLWEVQNVLMLLSATEALVFLVLTILVVARVRWKLFHYIQKPEVLFCLVFALIFAFAVGVSTYNFGTLSRYKIPLMPYFMLAIGLIHHYWNSERKLAALDSTE